MRGAERPSKVQWTRPFLQPLKPLGQLAAQKTFIDIADDGHNPEEIDKVLALADNMPLAINLLAHLVDSESCSYVLSRWQAEKTSLISDGYDRGSNLDLSIALSLSSPRITAVPHAQDLLSILSILPDGLSDNELVESRLPIDEILRCKTALTRTTLAYIDEHKRLKVLVPIREYIQKLQPPRDHIMRPLLKYFQSLLESYTENPRAQSNSGTVAQIFSNYTNIQNVLGSGLRADNPDLKNSIDCTLSLNRFSRLTGRGNITLFEKIPDLLPQPCDHHLQAHFIMELFGSWTHNPPPNPETLILQALEHFENFEDPDLKCRSTVDFVLRLT
jgi:hypothetical protein